MTNTDQLSISGTATPQQQAGAPVMRYRWLTVGERYRYSARPGKGTDSRRGELCEVLTVPRPGSTPGNVLVRFADGAEMIVPAGVLKAVKP